MNTLYQWYSKHVFNQYHSSAESAALFLSHPEVRTFFQYAASGAQERTHQALILGLRLGPHLYITSSSTYSDVLCAGDVCTPTAVPPWLEAMFHRAVETECVWAEGSVRNAWILGLASMCSVPNGFHWALKRGNTLMYSLNICYVWEIHHVRSDSRLTYCSTLVMKKCGFIINNLNLAQGLAVTWYQYLSREASAH